ncbi:hypothetical protein DFA_05324 [Cavenderia fasciculata]|uniref:PH domain-containing protein n=1 Tax=Cavenderia fasciculata TaxID=261658 RepID=F4PKX0_CACFS|nr:uncharacterized protein DFA_05324 [Cavenderia fasciculata]EGG23192.1 hypothetical protein DFA_05324 [Cavenderia fasciculata]|eukprot:XP_004361043.1 hypothetical protein DFA_05324 [Cavenderia fasciculata]
MSAKIFGGATAFFLLGCWALLIVSFAVPWYETYEKKTETTVLYKLGGVEAKHDGEKTWVKFNSAQPLTKRTMESVVVFAILAWVFVTVALVLVVIKTLNITVKYISPLIIVDLGLAFTCNILSYLILVGLQSAQLTDCFATPAGLTTAGFAQCNLDHPATLDAFYFENNLWNNRPYTAFYTSLVSSFLLVFSTVCAYSGWLKKWGSRELQETELNVLEKSCSGSGYQSSLPSVERVGTLKLRWFILQSDFLNYYDKLPKDVNDTSCLKGQIYLKGCKLKHGGIITPIYQHWSIGMSPNTQKNWKSVMAGDLTDAISLITPNAVEYTLTSCHTVQEDFLKDLENWAYALSYAIRLADKVKDEPIQGWMNKRGEKGHQFRNTKRRWFLLQGNKIRYFTAMPRNNKIVNLKGIIDVTHISEISDKMLTEIRGQSITVVSDGEWSGGTVGTGPGGADCFGSNGEPTISDRDVTEAGGNSIGPVQEIKTVIGLGLLIDNEKEFVLLFDSQEDRVKWVTAITNTIERTFTTTNVTVTTSKIINQPDKQVLVSGWMRKTKANKWWDKRYFTLTPTRLIYYKEDPPQKTLGSIFLLVSSCRVVKQKSLDGLDWCFSIADSRGIEYFFNTETQDQMERWIKAIKTARKKLILALLEQAGKVTIPINLGKDCGLVTITTKETIRINSLSNKIAYEIPVINTKTVSVVQENKVEIIYTPTEGEVSENRVEITSHNPHGVLQLFKDLFSAQENTIN